MQRLFLPLLLTAGAAWAAPQVQLSPDAVVLGREHEVRLTLRSPATLAWVVSEGELKQLDPQHLVWSAPDSGVPRTALLLLWDAAAATPDPVTVRVPLIGRTDLDIDTERRATVVVEIAGKSFGPTTANARGKVTVSVEVPPGATEALVHAQVSGRRTERKVPLQLPPDQRVLATLTPHPIGPSGGWLLVTGSQPLTEDDVTVDVQHAQATPVRGSDPLVYSVVPAHGTPEITAMAEFRNDPESRTMTAAAVSQTPVVAAAPSLPIRWYASGEVGGFLGSGAAGGFSLALTGGINPGWLSRRLELELSIGWEHTGLSQVPVGPDGTAQTALGVQHSSINVLPIVVAAHVAALQRGPWEVGARVGVGLAPWDHRLSSDFDASFREGGVTWALQAGVDVAYAWGHWSPYLAAGYQYLPRLQTDHLSAQLGGPRAELGVRYSF